MKKLIYILFVLLFVISCTSNTIYKKPENLITESEMVDLLVDMQIAIGGRSARNNEAKYTIDYMPFVYEKYGIDSARFAQSSYYYSTDIDNYNKILTRVKNKLVKMREANDLLVEEKDSIDKAENPVLKAKRVSKFNKEKDSLIK